MWWVVRRSWLVRITKAQQGNHGRALFAKQNQVITYTIGKLQEAINKQMIKLLQTDKEELVGTKEELKGACTERCQKTHNQDKK